MYRHERVPPKTALPQLPRRITRGLQVNKTDLRFYPELPRLPHTASIFMMFRHETLCQSRVQKNRVGVSNIVSYMCKKPGWGSPTL